MLALEYDGPAIYNVVDDEPAPVREWLPVLAKALGAKPPRRFPRWLARLFAGEAAVMMGTESRGASNEKAKRELDWTPATRAGGKASPRPKTRPTASAATPIATHARRYRALADYAASPDHARVAMDLPRAAAAFFATAAQEPDTLATRVANRT
ncbi:MAG: hypothetical protein ACRDNG_00155 [Gaiellaceae bacterium]